MLVLAIVTLINTDSIYNNATAILILNQINDVILLHHEQLHARLYCILHVDMVSDQMR